MGLGIEVGHLANLVAWGEDTDDFEATLETVNALLARRGLPSHVEPRTAPTVSSRCSMAGFPYSTLHYLRLAYAHRANNPRWVAAPVPDKVIPMADPTLQEIAGQFDSHLLCHSDCEGLYVPVDFPDVLFARPDDDLPDDLPGDLLGSTFRLREELALVAPALGIALDADGELPDPEAARLDGIGEDDPMSRELLAWFALWEAARVSLASGCAIVYC